MSARVYTVPAFDKFLKKQRIDEVRLIDAVDRAENGLTYADLGGEVVKLAVARPGESAKHGYRTIVGFRKGSRAIFLFGFAKNEADNITANALEDYRAVAAALLKLPEPDFEGLVTEEVLREVKRPKRDAASPTDIGHQGHER